MSVGVIYQNADGKVTDMNPAAERILGAGLAQISDRGALVGIVDQIIAANPQPVAEYLAGKENIAKFLVGQVMKATKGQGNPALVNELVLEKLKALKP